MQSIATKVHEFSIHYKNVNFIPPDIVKEISSPPPQNTPGILYSYLIS
jgi:hypothetical protein